MIYYINSKEDPHKFTPHVHVKYNDEDMFVYLNKETSDGNYDYKGNFKNPSKKKAALKYIKQNFNDIKKKWDDIKR